MALTVDGNLNFNKTLRTKAFGCVMLKIINVDTSETIMHPVTVDWTEENGQIIIKQITGLEANTTYRITLLIV